MNSHDFTYLANVLHRRAGIILAEKKTHMIETRLMPVVRRFGFRDLCSLLKELHYGHEALVQAVIEAMTTNDSAFFRDRKTFEEFRDIVLPALKDARRETKQIRIWCAACAAGQEPYSIAMVLDDAKLVDEGWAITLFATDIHSQMIARAQDGIYSQFEVQRGLPIRRLVSNFQQEGANWRISDHLRRMVTFRTFNLLDSYGWLRRRILPQCADVFRPQDARLGARSHWRDSGARRRASRGAGRVHGRICPRLRPGRQRAGAVLQVETRPGTPPVAG
jgi:chemotaxis protein methyltransferase CheR